MCVEGFARCVASCDTRRKSGVSDGFEVIRMVFPIAENRGRSEGLYTSALYPILRDVKHRAVPAESRGSAIPITGIFGTTGHNRKP